MKRCRTLNGLLNAIEKGEACELTYTSKARTSDGYIVYQTNGTNLIVTNETYQKIEPYLRQKA
ncbi:hypothetical protein IMZ31_24190 (plasmid) [Pontibacillus sp. ALD_SL1]|uniref:hypothetical protein n=1 Tax=Pontibacillus sp. ALD_SL1 TaxID=2777185 RepID=UPI001A962ADF|nr:hypothetical protein [Pontibacillus sp. ALD_SL1]QST02553.1 hypothetical protein IMZ31_24190 [Pontibacillus sp. ALD_SL1]